MRVTRETVAFAWWHVYAYASWLLRQVTLRSLFICASEPNERLAPGSEPSVIMVPERRPETQVS